MNIIMWHQTQFYPVLFYKTSWTVTNFGGGGGGGEGFGHFFQAHFYGLV